jgi:hypothetical protein
VLSLLLQAQLKLKTKTDATLDQLKSALNILQLIAADVKIADSLRRRVSTVKNNILLKMREKNSNLITIAKAWPLVT